MVRNGVQSAKLFINLVRAPFRSIPFRLLALPTLQQFIEQSPWLQDKQQSQLLLQCT